MSDIATLGIAIDTTDVARGVTELDKFTAAGQRAQTRADAMGDSIRRQNASMVQVQSVTAQSAAAIDRTTAAYQKLDDEVARIILSSNKVAQAQAQLGRGQAVLSEGLQAGVLSQKAYDDALASLTAKYGPAAEGAAKLTVAHGATTISASFLTREMRALGDELASGRTRQAEGTFALLASRLLSLGPIGIATGAAIAGIGVAIGLIVSRENDLEKAVLGIENGFKASGGSAQASEAQIRDYIKALSLLPGVSREAAEKSLTELSRIPEITSAQFQTSSKILADFAALEGKDLPAAAKDLAKALEDPASGARKLSDDFSALTLKQRLLIDDYLLHGERAKAVDVILDALAVKTKGMANDAVTPLGRAVNDVAIAWQHLGDRFADDSASKSAEQGVSRLIDRFATFIKFLADSRVEFKKLYDSLPAGSPKQMALGGLMPIGMQTTINGPSPTSQGVSGRLLGADGQPLANPMGTDGVAAQNATAAATAETNKQIEAQLRGLHNLGDGYNGTAERMQKLVADQKRFQEGLKLTSDPAQQGYLNAKIKDVQEQIDAANKKGAGKIQPLGFAVDEASLNAALKANDVVAEAQKQNLADQQRLDDFYHQTGVKSDKDFYDAKIASLDQYLRIEHEKVEKDVALRQQLDAALANATPGSAEQAYDISKRRIDNQAKINELIAQESKLKKQIGVDDEGNIGVERKLLTLEEQRAERVTATNLAMAKTQEIETKLGETIELINIRSASGTTTQLESQNARNAAALQAIAGLREQIATLEQLRATDIATNDTADSEKKLAAIHKIDIEILKLSADLDPIGKQLNQAFNGDLVSFFDKFGSGGIKTFKDLKAAAKDFFGSITSQIAHQANQNLADDLMKSLNLKTNDLSGGTGGIGGLISRGLGLTGASATKPNPTTGGSSATDDPMGEFIKKIGAANDSLGDTTKSTAGLIEKQVLGTTTEAAATTTTTSATSALTALTSAAYQAATALSSISAGGGGSGGTGGLGGLFGGGSSGGSVATSAQMSQADSMAASASSFSADGIVPFLHGGGIVGRNAAFHRFMSFSQSDVASAPRFHSGGVAGLAGYEQLAVLKKGEEVLTDDDPRHRSNGGRSGGRGMRVTQNFTVEPTASRSSQQQIGARAAAGLNSVVARGR